MRKEDFFEVLGELDDDIVKGAKTTMKKRMNWKAWGAMAACLIVVLFVALGYTDSRAYTVTLDNGATINFIKSNITAGSLDIDADVTSRELSQEELYTLFGNLQITGEIYTNDIYTKILGFSGKIRDTKLVISAPNVPLVDAVVVGSEKASVIEGIDVTAGYFLTDPNSKGVRTAIFYASFELGDYTIYVEDAGPDSESETISSNLAATICDLIENGEIDFTQIYRTLEN